MMPLFSEEPTRTEMEHLTVGQYLARKIACPVLIVLGGLLFLAGLYGAGLEPVDGDKSSHLGALMFCLVVSPLVCWVSAYKLSMDLFRHREVRRVILDDERRRAKKARRQRKKQEQQITRKGWWYGA